MSYVIKLNSKIEMNKIYIVIILFFSLSDCVRKGLPEVRIVTSFGDIIVEVDTARAPITANNFLNLVEKGIYEEAAFYRIVRSDNQPDNNIKIEVIQGGLFDDEKIEKYPSIKHETTEQTGIQHLDGAISMARYTPGTASTEFFICIGDQPELDYSGKRNPDGQGFAAFGRVVKGMDVAREIQLLPDSNQYLKQQVIIRKAEIVRQP